MKMKIKILAASIAVALSGQAAAALDLPSTNNGSLWLTVWDTSVGSTTSYTRDLGLNIDTFLTNGLGGDKTPAVGLTLNFATDALYATTFASISTSNLAWNVFAAGTVVASAANPGRIITTAPTSTVNTPTFSRNNVNNAAINANFFATDLNANWGCGPNPSCSVNDPSAAGFGGNPARWTGSIGGAVPFNTSAGIGSLLNFYYFAANTTGALQADAKIVFANATGRATWSLDALGNATYALAGPAAVPVPAAVWLLGSGLVGMVGVARRRKEKA